MKPGFLFLFTFFFSFSTIAQSSPEFSRSEVLEDLEYLYHSLQDAHFDSTGKLDEMGFRERYRTLRASIRKDSFTLLEATNLLQPLVSYLDVGHTNIDFPIAAYVRYAEGGGTVFPLEIAFEDGRALVRKNFSNDPSIRVGDEVRTTNGESIEGILQKIYPHISAERTYLKNAKIELYSFPRYYWQAYGEQPRFTITTVRKGTELTHNVPAISLVEGYEGRRSEVFNARMHLEFREKLAILNPGNFSGDEMAYRRFIDSAFQDIRSRETDVLVVDLRNNLGGDNSFSDYLVSYFADRAFRWNSSFTLKTSAFLKQHIREHRDTTETFWREALDREDGAVYSYSFAEYPPQPEEKRFRGQVFVLVNRQSHSQAAVTAAQIQDYNFGTIVGEETGDYPSLTASIFQYALPNTNITVNVAKGYMVRVNGSKKEEGVIPDILIRDHLLDEEDEILRGLMEYLGREF
ncbi:S41 family peptidase [Lewinella sp. W8]|uniref:S41 family peptidase n=1 Tax=Lewinella sp. W8 TaxID=2528208 RepID=UPI0010674A04|nr:S41 family peptidase [Lewinella sp. W8]MTB51025.1 peptidase S41 [Lewinella sp. W8]